MHEILIGSNEKEEIRLSLSTLTRFNGIVSWLAFELFEITGLL